jgi:hypothetical protein
MLASAIAIVIAMLRGTKEATRSIYQAKSYPSQKFGASD